MRDLDAPDLADEEWDEIVTRSAEVLDRAKPNWLDLMNLGTFNMWTNCVLDQVFDAEAKADRLGYNNGYLWATRRVEEIRIRRYELGFGGGDRLEAAWRRYITRARREVATVKS